MIVIRKCIRCDKSMGDGMHTCSPTKQYRAGMAEGMTIIINEINEMISISMSFRNSGLEHAECSIITLHAIKEVSEMIRKRYSGEYDAAQ